ncbi:tRNA (cytidine(34)-2'-O)-methyltransferase [Sphingomonas sp.]|uniref:tRNA (cytidine(34)-2'-O)-methyltransferase n=1 Tax=Sphingomonas sp. TaxID=28214 RepID=UPI002DD6B263|nr:tRNA (cytidine(34)-2'-O)-methyltransferase [Sphingomonas sp.]
MRIALYQPDIAGNVGAVMRTCACLGVALDLIEPMGFMWDDRRVARAAMDYIDHVDLTRHRSWDAFEGQARGRLVLLTTRGATPLHDFAFDSDDILLFGRESAGVPDHVHARADARVVIPMAPPLRSLNLGVSAAIVLAEGLRQTGRWPATGGQFVPSTPPSTLR